MKKLHLDLDQLAVESFDTRDAAVAADGSVHGAEATVETCISDCNCEPSYTCPFTFHGHLVDTNMSCVIRCLACATGDAVMCQGPTPLC